MTRRPNLMRRPGMPYLLCGFGILLCYVLYRLYAVSALYAPGAAELTVAFILMALALTGAVLYYIDRLDRRTAAFLILAGGIALRVMYMLYTPVTVRQHDVLDLNGHADYILQLANNFRLPASNAGEFYHPPLMYLLGAAVYRCASLFGSGLGGSLDAVKLIPCFASCAALILSYRILRDLGLSGPALFLPAALVAFHPAFLYLSASINNDMLALFFLVVALRYALRWHRSGSMKDILCLAAAVGLGMMTKLSAALAAPPIAALFLVHLAREARQGRLKKPLAQYCAFGAVSLPLGLWYPLRNYLLFRQPLFYVLRFSESLPIYCGNHSPAERFFSFPLASQLIGRVFGDTRVDYNLYIFTLKSALFGEWSFAAQNWPALLLSMVNLALVILSLLSMLWLAVSFRKNKKARVSVCFLGLVWLTQIVSFVLFNVRYPFGCSMDFRYITVTVFTGAAFLGLALDDLRRRHPRFAAPAVYVLAVLTVAFCGLSALFYTSV